VREEVRIEDGQILEIAEFFHPRTQEIADTLPGPLGDWLMRTPWARRLVDRATRKGKVVKTTSVGGFLLPYTLAKLKRPGRPRLRWRSDAAATLNALIKAALADEDGQALDKAIAGLSAAEPMSKASSMLPRACG